MRIALLLPVVAVLVSCAQPQNPHESARPIQSQLIALSGDGELAEVERTVEYSIMTITKAPQGSVASSMFALRGACAILRARQATFVTSQPVAGADRSYRLKFPSTASPGELSGASKSVFTRADCSALRF